MKVRYFPFIAVLLAGPAAAQTRVLVIPDGNGVAIPSRGALPTVPLMSPRASRPRTAADATPYQNDELLTWQNAKRLWPLVPLAIAGAVVAATLPGGGGGGAGAPAATR